MKRTPAWAILALSTGLPVVFADGPFQHSLVHGTFTTEGSEARKEKKERKERKEKHEKHERERPEGLVHPLAPHHRLDAIQNNNAFRILHLAPGGMPSDPFVFPVLKDPAAKEPTALEDFREGETFFCPVDLVGSGVSDLIYARKGSPGWRVLTNGQRLPSPVQGFLAGYYEKGSDSRRMEAIPADTGDLTVDQDLLAATGDFLGTGAEQLAFTRPGATHVWIVGAHGVHTMRADLKGIEPTPPGKRSHWLFSFKGTRPGQHTRLAYYRAGSDHLIRLSPKGMEFVSEKVPLKGNWERLNQAVVDWPIAPGAAGAGSVPGAQAAPAGDVPVEQRPTGTESAASL